MDPIANMLIALKNGNRAGRSVVSVPYSKLKHAVAECLKKESYVGLVRKVMRRGFPMLDIELVYDGKKPKITGVERVSKQSRRVYLPMKGIRPVRQGTGLLVLSTPKGVISGALARKEHVGGEALFKIW